MSEKVPAWKKLGLKVNDESHTPVNISHIESGNLTRKQLKKVKRVRDDGDNSDKKPPKRVKLPKSERKPAPVKDQYTYLKVFSTDKENWKFSKQKQNWIIKNIKSVPDEYEGYLIEYLATTQGGSRTRLVEELRKVVEEWNKRVKEVKAKIEKKLQAKLEGREITDDEPKADETENEEAATQEYAIRCKKLLESLGESVSLEDEEVALPQEKADEPEEEDDSKKANGVESESEDSKASGQSSDSNTDSESETSSSDSSSSASSSSSDSDSSSDSSSDEESDEESDSSADNLIIDHVELK